MPCLPYHAVALPWLCQALPLLSQIYAKCCPESMHRSYSIWCYHCLLAWWVLWLLSFGKLIPVMFRFALCLISFYEPLYHSMLCFITYLTLLLDLLFIVPPSHERWGHSAVFTITDISVEAPISLCWVLQLSTIKNKNVTSWSLSSIPPLNMDCGCVNTQFEIGVMLE